jgi:hypothetical protein
MSGGAKPFPPCGGRWPEGPDEGSAPRDAGFLAVPAFVNVRRSARPLIRPTSSATFPRKGGRGAVRGTR